MTLVATTTGLAGAWFDEQKHHPGPITLPSQPQHPVLQKACQQLTAYFAGNASAGFVFTLPLDPQGTAFQRQVWQALLQIPAGSLQSYGHIAQQLGHPSAARAVGAAVGRNPISIVVPCHRVVGGSGALTGYAGGIERKQALLLREGANPQTMRHSLATKQAQPELRFA
jgi:methylated-DNA-[protein]-cysteine S-methyltransferase